IDQQRIHVIPLGINRFDTNSEKPISAPAKPYFLFVGVIKPRKNVLGVVKAFAEFKKSDADSFHLIIAGKEGAEYQRKIEEFIIAENLTNWVAILNHVSDYGLSALYRNAEALVFPSLWEGWGLPVLEAFAAGVPVITSNRSGTKEAAGDAALLVDPENFQDIAAGMKEILKPDIRKQLIEKGRRRALEFSWEKSAKKYLELFKSIK
ncbi:MAG: glycosyltransferase family 1 protein, partial [bacterium]|nr:glycosyltransferase family 1 protein [bacterium]